MHLEEIVSYLLDTNVPLQQFFPPYAYLFLIASQPLQPTHFYSPSRENGVQRREETEG